ncbi:hypothetical protein KR093_002503 [Drosophila rubida]|uniref:Uncharacterized protein n=1 Tax=Drosophila rubida TaxID=30044 RepID=A0AAD4KGC2_9MUSC|nr:hypothetical protein KR093_002503 [Drosophila rubida]
MPKKVITRRQRKAAEAKRQTQEESVIPSETLSNNIATVPPMPVAVQPSNNAIQNNNADQLVAKSKHQIVDVVETEGKTTVRIIVNDQNVKTAEKKLLDVMIDENVNIKVNETKVPTPPGPSKEQGSFSKSLTRKAAATITKIQKLSKALAFNKKLCYKHQQKSAEKVAEPTTSTDNSLDETIKKALEGSPNKGSPCSCEFCKVVLSQLLPGKKLINDKLKCKNSKRANDSPGHNVENEECKLLPSLGSRRHILQLLEKKEKQLARNMIKRIKQFEKQQPSALPERVESPKICKRHELQQKQTIKSASSTLPETETKRRDDESPKTAINTPHQVTSTRENFLNAIQKLESPPAPVKVIGNTGYFVLTGTNDQLAVQLAELEGHSVLIRRCKLLVPGVPDAVEPQLEELDETRKQILQQMHSKHELLEPRRQRRIKQPSKYH